MTNNDSIRSAAEKRLKAQRAFWRMLGGFVILWAAMIVIWAVDGAGYFWPFWVFFGTGLATIFTGWGAFGPRDSGPSEAQIQEEMRKYQGPPTGN